MQPLPSPSPEFLSRVPLPSPSPEFLSRVSLPIRWVRSATFPVPCRILRDLLPGQPNAPIVVRDSSAAVERLWQ